MISRSRRSPSPPSSSSQRAASRTSGTLCQRPESRHLSGEPTSRSSEFVEPSAPPERGRKSWPELGEHFFATDRMFFSLNFSRPAHHTVKIRVYICGNEDVAAGVRLVKDIYAQCLAHAKQVLGDGAGKRISGDVLATRTRAKWSQRHEKFTYEPYHNDEMSGWKPNAKEEEHRLKYWQDTKAADMDRPAFVAVISQFFASECIKPDTGLDVNMLDYLVPRPGGVLAFQFGFNTSCPRDKEKDVWDYLIEKIRKAGARIAFVNNNFSFDRRSGKPGEMSIQHTYGVKLKERAGPSLVEPRV